MSLEWQQHEPNEWVLGTLVRGFVRNVVGGVYYDEEKNPSWIWIVWREHYQQRGAANSLVFAIEAVEVELGIGGGK